jgi:hypothetical protein
VTDQPQPVSRDASRADQITNPIREAAAFALLAANALLLIVGLIDLAVPTDESFPDRAARAFFTFAGLVAVLLPVLAVVLATHIQPPVRRAKLITQIALVEYAVSALLAVVAFFAWLIGGLSDAAFRSAFTGLLTRIAYFAIFAIAAFVVFKVWRAFYYRPRRVPRPGRPGQPGIYGQPAPSAAGLPPEYPPPPEYDRESGYGPNPVPGFGPPAAQPRHGQQSGVPAQPTETRVESGDAIDETQVLHRPADESADLAKTQAFEPVHRERERADSPEPDERPDTPRR